MTYVWKLIEIFFLFHYFKFCPRQTSLCPPSVSLDVLPYCFRYLVRRGAIHNSFYSISTSALKNFRKRFHNLNKLFTLTFFEFLMRIEKSRSDLIKILLLKNSCHFALTEYFFFFFPARFRKKQEMAMS